MLAFLFSLVAATTYPTCDAIDSCLGVVNGTKPLPRFVPTLPNGGYGHTFTTSNCLDGTLPLTESCMCGTTLINNYASYPGYCYSGIGNSLAKHDYAFCAHQFGLNKNIFFPMNATQYLQCHCYDPATGISQLAHVGKPMCTLGFARYEDCDLLDGTSANKAKLAPYTGAIWAAIQLLYPHESQRSDRQPSCQCGAYGECKAPTTADPNNKPYCQYLAEVCTTVKDCGIGEPWAPTGIFDDDGCACGDETCMHGEICEYQEKDGKHMFACSWNGQSSEVGSIIKGSKAMSGMAFIFTLLVVIFALFACICTIVTYCKAKKI